MLKLEAEFPGDFSKIHHLVKVLFYAVLAFGCVVLLAFSFFKKWNIVTTRGHCSLSPWGTLGGRRVGGGSPATFVGSGRSAVRPVPFTHWLQTYRSVLSRQGDNYRKVFQETGNLEDGVWSAGIVMGLIDVP